VGLDFVHRELNRWIVVVCYWCGLMWVTGCPTLREELLLQGVRKLFWINIMEY